MPADRDRVIRLRVEADSRRAQAELAALAASQERHTNAQLASNQKLQRAEANRNGFLTQHIGLINKVNERNIKRYEAEAAGAKLSELNAKREAGNLERLAKLREEQTRSVLSLNRAFTQQQLTLDQATARERVIELRAELNTKDYEAGLARIAAGNKPKVTLEAALDSRRVTTKIKELERRKVELKADIDTAKLQKKIAAAIASAGGDTKGVAKAEGALHALEEAFGETEKALSGLTGGGGAGGGGGGGGGGILGTFVKGVGGMSNAIAVAAPFVAGLVAGIAGLIGELLAAGEAAGAMAGAVGGVAVVAVVGLTTALAGPLSALKEFSAAQSEVEQSTTKNLTAMQKYEYQLSKLTPAGQKFTKLLTGQVLPALDQLKAVSESSFLPGLQEGFEKLLTITPQFEGLLKGVGDTIGKVATQFGTFLTSGDGADEFSSLLKGIKDTADSLLPGLEKIGEAILSVFGAGAGAASTFFDKFNQVATSFADWIQGLSNSGELQAFFAKGEQYLEDFLGLLGDIGELIQTAFGGFTQGDGPGFLDLLRGFIQTLTDMADAANDFGLIMDGLKTLGVIVFGAIGAVVVILSGAFIALGAAVGIVVDLLKELATAVLPNWLLEKIGLTNEDTDAQGKNNEATAEQIRLLKEKQSLDAGLKPGQDLGDELASLQEGGKLYNDMAAAVTASSQATNALASSHANAKKAADSYNDSVSKLADTVTAASRAERDANEALSKTYRDDKRALEQDRKDIAEEKKNVKRTKADGIDAVAKAENAVAAAQRASKKAQDNVNLARKEALRDLIALRQEVERGTLNEEKGALALRRAQEKYYALLKDPGASANDKEEARLDVNEKLLDNRETRTTNQNNQADLNDAEKKGVEGSDKVKTAIQERIDATKNEKQAVKDLEKARTTAADNNVKAIAAEKAAEQKLADDKAQFAIDERNARERQQDAHKAYLQSLKDESTQLAKLKADKQAAFDDEALKSSALKKQLQTQEFAGTGVGADGKTIVQNKTLSDKDATEYIKLLNGLDTGIRAAITNVGLPNSLGGLRELIGQVNAYKKKNPKASASEAVTAGTNALSRFDPITGEGGRYTKTPSGRLITDPTSKTPEGTYSSPSGSSVASQSLAPGQYYGKDGKVHGTAQKTIAELLGGGVKDVKKSAVDTTKAFGLGIKETLPTIAPDIAGDLSKSITGGGGAIQKTTNDDLEIHSPSKVALRMGGAFGQGLNDGLVQSVDTIRNTITTYYTGSGKNSLVKLFADSVGEPQGKQISGALGVGFDNGLLQSVSRIMGTLDKYYSGTGKESVIGKMLGAYGIGKGGYSQKFFDIAGAIWVGFKNGFDNSVKTVTDAANRMMNAVFNAVRAVAEPTGALFSTMMLAADANMKNGTVLILQTLAAFVTEVNKVTSEYGITLATPTIPPGAQAVPFPAARKAKGGFAGAPTQGDYQRYDTGGMVRGSGGGTEDKEIIRISPREFVQPEHSVNYYGADVMEGLRTRRIPREAVAGYATGGQPLNATYKQGLMSFATGGTTKKKDPYKDKYPGPGSISELYAVAQSIPGDYAPSKSERYTDNTGYSPPGFPHAKTHGGSTNHGKHMAVDFNAPGASVNHAYEGKIAAWWYKNYKGVLKELIYTLNDSPPWKGYYVKNGKDVGPYGPAADHRNHVHVAAAPGFSKGKGDFGAGTDPVLFQTDPTNAKKKLGAISFGTLSKKFGDIGKTYATYLQQMFKDGYAPSLIKKLLVQISNRLDNAASSGVQPDLSEDLPSNLPIKDLAPKSKNKYFGGNPGNNLRIAFATAKGMGANKREMLGLMEAGLQESAGFHNYANEKVPLSKKHANDGVRHDGTSVGILQQLVGADGSGKDSKGRSLGWGDYNDAMNPAHATKTFLDYGRKHGFSNKNVLASHYVQLIQRSGAGEKHYANQRAAAIGVLKELGYKDADFKGLSGGGFANTAYPMSIALNGFAQGGMSAGVVAPSRSLGATAARITGAGSTANGGSRFNVENLNITNPMPERAGDSIYRRVETLKSIYG